MKKVGCLLILMVALFLAGNVFAQEQVQAPVPKEGEWWEFKAVTKDAISSSSDQLNGNYRVVFKGGKPQVLQIVGDKGEGVEIGGLDADELKRMMAAGQDERQYLKFPLAVGNKWSVDYLHHSPGRRPQRRYIDFEIKSIEEITVAAGTFRTYKIEGFNTAGGQQTGRVQQRRTIYYSPDAKCVVKFYYDSAVGGPGAKTEIELIRYGDPQKN